MLAVKLPFLSALKSVAALTGAAASPAASSLSLIAADAPAAAPTVADPVAERVVAQIRAELPDLIVVAVVDTASGHDLASFTSIPSFNPHDAAAVNAEVVRHKARALHVFHLDDEQIEDIIISTTSHHHLIKTVNNLQKFIYLAVFAHSTGLGFAREVLRRNALDLVA